MLTTTFKGKDKTLFLSNGNCKGEITFTSKADMKLALAALKLVRNWESFIE